MADRRAVFRLDRKAARANDRARQRRVTRARLLICWHWGVERRKHDAMRLPEQMPVIAYPPVVLRPFGDEDAALVQTAGSDALIPLITTVPASGDLGEARAYVARQPDRLISGEGYSFAIADAVTGEAVGQIGLGLRNLDQGIARTGYWVGSQFRRRGYAGGDLAGLSGWGL